MKHANRLRELAQMSEKVRSAARIGTITAYDPSVSAVKVAIEPSGVETGWIPLLSPWVGNGWGMVCAPSLGDVVSVLFDDGSQSAGFAALRFFTDLNRSPAAPGGEFWLVHKNGQTLKMLNSGAAIISDGHGATITMNGDGTITSQGNWTHTGNVTVNGTVTATTDVVGGGIHLKTHVHGGVQPGSGTSGAPA